MLLNLSCLVQKLLFRSNPSDSFALVHNNFLLSRCILHHRQVCCLHLPSCRATTINWCGCSMPEQFTLDHIMKAACAVMVCCGPARLCATSSLMAQWSLSSFCKTSQHSPASTLHRSVHEASRLAFILFVMDRICLCQWNSFVPENGGWDVCLISIQAQGCYSDIVALAVAYACVCL